MFSFGPAGTQAVCGGRLSSRHHAPDAVGFTLSETRQIRGLQLHLSLSHKRDVDCIADAEGAVLYRVKLPGDGTTIFVGWESTGAVLAVVQKLGGAFLWFPAKPGTVQQWEGMQVESRTPLSLCFSIYYTPLAPSIHAMHTHTRTHAPLALTLCFCSTLFCFDPFLWTFLPFLDALSCVPVLLQDDEELGAQTERPLRHVLRLLERKRQAGARARRRQLCRVGSLLERDLHEP